MAALRSSLRHSTHFSTSATTTPSYGHTALKLLFQNDKNPDKALETYNTISSKDISPIKPLDALSYTVKILSKAKRFDDIESLIESHKKSPKITEERFISALIRTYGEARMPDRALRLFDEIQDLGATRSTLSFNALLQAHIKAKKYSDVKKLLDEIPQKYGVTPNGVSYGILIKSFCVIRKPAMCLPILEEMEEKNIEVTSHAYTDIAQAFYKQGKDDEAEKIWGKMKEKGRKLDVVAFNVRIMYSRREEAKTVLGLIEEMKAEGMKPDIFTYNKLMSCYFWKGMLAEAVKVYEGLEENGCAPNGETFNMLVNYHCKGGDFEKAYAFFKESEKMTKEQPIELMRNLVQGLLKISKMKEAKELIDKVTASAEGVPETWNEFLVQHGLGSASA